MANTYTWTFPTLQTYIHQDGLENVVYIVHWYYTGNCSPDSGSHSYQMFGAQTITPFVSGSRPFIPYEQLTEAIVQEWVEESLGTEKLVSMRSSIDSQIDNLINPPIAYLPPPWATPTPSPTSEIPIDPTSGPTPEPTPTPSAI
jgi:hypothetical protein